MKYFVIFLVLIGFAGSAFAAESEIPPPLKQMQLGIKLGHIICDEDKIPTWNVHNKPACVYPDSESKLLTRGWAKLRLVLPVSLDPIKELEWTGQNEVTYRILGNLRSGDEPPPSTLDEKRKIVWEYAQKYHLGERFLEYSIPTSGMYHFNVGDKIQFEIMEWGNYFECWDLNVRIFDTNNDVLYEDTLNKSCLEPDGKPGWFSSYSVGKESEIICEKPGYYMIEVSNGEIFPPTILQNFACLDTISEIEPSTRIEISFGNVAEKKLLPVVISQITTNAKSLDVIKVWGFELIGHSGDDRGKAWEIIPREQRIWYEITDEQGQDVIDKTRMPENWARPDDLHIYQMDCGLFHIVEGESAHPIAFAINEGTTTIIAKNTDKGIYPNSNGEYSIEFASIFENSVKLPEGAEIISQESKDCKLTQNIEDDYEGKYTEGYYTKMVFRLESELSLINEFEVVKDDIVFDVGYNVTGGIIEDMVYSADTNSLLITIDSNDEGNLTLSIPRALLDAKFDYCPPINPHPPDDNFFVLLDGEEILYDEILTTTAKRTLQISFLENTTKMEIIAACLI